MDRRSRDLRPDRLAAMLAVLGLHAALILLLLQERQLHRFAREQSLLVLIDLAPPAERATSPQSSRSAGGSVQPRNPAPRLGGAATPAAAPAENASAAIDWAGEASTVAGASASKSEPRSMSNGLPLRLDLQIEKPRPPSDFGWSEARTHRVEMLPGGGTLVRLNDRCAVVIGLPLILPVCKFGKIPARGDLFKHMNEARPVPPAP